MCFGSYYPSTFMNKDEDSRDKSYLFHAGTIFLSVWQVQNKCLLINHPKLNFNQPDTKLPTRAWWASFKFDLGGEYNFLRWTESKDMECFFCHSYWNCWQLCCVLRKNGTSGVQYVYISAGAHHVQYEIEIFYSWMLWGFDSLASNISGLGIITMSVVVIMQNCWLFKVN